MLCSTVFTCTSRTHVSTRARRIVGGSSHPHGRQQHAARDRGSTRRTVRRAVHTPTTHSSAARGARSAAPLSRPPLPAEHFSRAESVSTFLFRRFQHTTAAAWRYSDRPPRSGDSSAAPTRERPASVIWGLISACVAVEYRCVMSMTAADSPRPAPQHGGGRASWLVPRYRRGRGRGGRITMVV